MTIVPRIRGRGIEAFFDIDGTPDGGMFSTLVVCNAIVVYRDVMSRDEWVIYENTRDFASLVDAFHRGLQPGHASFAVVIEGDGAADRQRLSRAIFDNLTTDD